jgi:DNA polymerase-4
MQADLAKDGITMIAQLQTRELGDLMRRYGAIGARLYHLSRGEDYRHVENGGEAKSVSAETTFNTDIADYKSLERILWSLSEKVSRRAKADHVSGHTVTLKLKTASFKLRTRSITLDDPTCLAIRMFEAAQPLLRREAEGTAYRLIGIGLAHLVEASDATEDSLDAHSRAKAKVEYAVDRLREKFGGSAVERGLAFKADDRK